MKKIIVVAAVLALAGTQLQTARAGGCDWATAGKILTGVAIGAAVVSAVNANADYSAGYYSYNAGPPRVVYAPAVVCAPRPVVVYAPPVVVYRPPVVCAPVVRAAPVVTVNYRHKHRHGHGRHGRW